MVEEEFQARLNSISDSGDSGGPCETAGGASSGPVRDKTIDHSPHAVPDQSVEFADLADAGQKAAAVAGKRHRRSAVGTLGKTVRLRDKDHRKFVLRQACLVCGRMPSDPHHLTFTQPRALGRRVSDEFTVPVCRVHHRELHRSGDEATWWRRLNIDPLPVALKLWQHSRADGELLMSIDRVSQQAQPTNTPNLSAHDGLAPSPDPNTRSETAV